MSEEIEMMKAMQDERMELRIRLETFAHNYGVLKRLCDDLYADKYTRTQTCKYLEGTVGELIQSAYKELK